MNADIQAFADQHGVDANAVQFSAEHIINEMTPELLIGASEDELLELVQAGALSASKAHNRMCIQALTRAGDINSVVYGIVKTRQAGVVQ